MSKTENWRSLALAYLASSLVALAYAAALVVWGEYPYRLFDGDFVHPHVIVRDMVAGGSLYDWNNSAALYIFPDWLFALTALLPLESRSASVLSGILLLVAFAFSGGLLVRTYCTRLGAGGAIILYGLGIVITPWLGGQLIQWLLDYAASIYIHTGASLLLLVSILLSSKILLNSDAKKTALLLAVLGAATTYSDPIYLPWFTAPLVASTAIIAAVTRNWRIVIGPSVVTVATVLAWVAERHKPFPSAGASLFNISPLAAVHNTYLIILDGLKAADTVILLYCVGAVMACILLLRTLITVVSTAKVTETNAQDLMLSMSSIAVLVLPIMAGAVDHPSKLRYMIAFVYLAPVFFLREAIPLLERRNPQRFVAGGVAILGILLLILSPALKKTFHEGQHTELISCLRARSLTDGFADYNFAKPVIFLTDDKIHLAQVGPHGPTNFSNRWRQERLDGSAFRPNFVITRNLREEDLARYGQPDEVLKCPENDVWVFSTALPTNLSP